MQTTYKTFFLLILNSAFLIFAVGIPLDNSFSQAYYPFPTTTATWTYQFYDDVWHQPTGMFTSINMSGDTVYNGYTYYLVPGGAIRESNKKIYVLPADSLQEYLLYDFNAGIGDTIFNIFNPVSWCDLDTLIVNSIDSVPCYNGFHKQYHYGWSPVIEGIGGIFGGSNPLLAPWYCVTVSGEWRLECFADSTGIEIYHPNILLLCGTLGINENDFVKDLTIYPNPLATQSKLIFKNPNKEKFFFTLYDITGRITETVSTITNEIILTKGSKQPGVYIYNLTNEKTGERINGKIVISN
jgi:type IX secretion system substrate protein